MCPHCRKEDFQNILNKEKIREINELRIRCTSREKGCEWVGELGTLKGHLGSDTGCGYEKVRCTNYAFMTVRHVSIYIGFTSTKQRCEVVMERRALTAHMQNECKYRLYKCEYCDYTDTFDAIAGSGNVTMKKRGVLSFVVFLRSQCKNHYASCGHYPLPCPNACGVRNIKRKNIEAHCGICPLEPLDCPFKDAGCTDKIRRRDMENHIESGTQKRLLMMFKSYQEDVKLNQELKARVERLEKKK